MEYPWWKCFRLNVELCKNSLSGGSKLCLPQTTTGSALREIRIWSSLSSLPSLGSLNYDSSPVIKLEIWVNSLHKFLLYLPVVFHERFMIEDWTKKLMQNGKKSFQIISCRSSRVFLREVSCPCNPTVFVLGFLCCQPMQQSPSLSNLWFPLLACKNIYIYIYIYILAPKHN